MQEKADYKFLFCIGVQKSGTSYLHNILRQHKAIAFSRYKELHFFSDENEYINGIDGFFNQFEPDDDTVYLADFTPEYINNPITVSNISAQFQDKAKIIILMRDPVKRAFSNYNMRVSRGKEKRTFHEVISDILANDFSDIIVSKGMYAEQLDTVFKYFNKNQVLLLVFEEFIKNKEKTLAEVMDFLELEYIDFNYDVKSNEKKDNRVTGIGKLFFKIPLKVRRNIFAKSRFLERLFKAIMTRSRKPIKAKPAFEDKTIGILKDYYRKSNERIRDDYGVDISEWI